MRILLLNLYYPPDTSATARAAYRLVQTMASIHRVTVLAGRPSYQPEERHGYYLFRRWRDKNLTVERVGSTTFDRRNLLGRAINYLSYLALALARALLLGSRFDLILAMTDPPLICLIGACVARAWGRPFVYNIRDLHPDMAVASGVVRSNALTRLWDAIHRWTLRQADWVIVLGEDMRVRVLAKGVPPERVVVVPDGADPLPVPEGNHSVREQIRGGFPFVAAYAGNLGFAGAWETLLEAARRIEGAGVALVFIGDGARKPDLESQARGLSNVRFLPFFPERDLPYVLTTPDLHIVTLRRGLEGLVVPSKLYTILLAGKPVLAVAPEGSDIVRIIRKGECGLVADPDDPAAVAEALLWARAHPDVLAEMGRRAYQIGQEFRWEVLAHRFMKVVEEVAFRPLEQKRSG
jgi:glycosyltransferase involved in cell wall biosynthesis